MHVLRRVALALAVAIGLVVLAPGIASADPMDGYYHQVANAFRSKPVYVDPHAKPTITSDQAQQLDNQIRATHKPIYLVLADNSQASKTSGPNEFLAGVHNALGGNTDEVIGVSVSKGLYANGYNEPSAVSNGAASLAKQTLSDAQQHGKPDPYSVYSQWIKAVAGIKVTSHSGSSSHGTASAASSTKHGLSGWAIFLIVLGGIVLVIVLIVVIVAVANSRKRALSTRQERDEIEIELDSVNTRLTNLALSVDLNDDAQREYDDGVADIEAARKGLKTGNLNSARRHVDSAESHRRRAQAYLDGDDPDAHPRVTHTSDDGYEPTSSRSRRATRRTRTSRPSDDSGVRVQQPGGSTTVINNTTYAPQSAYSNGYQHYYSGGYYGGMYFGPGYYADPFWNWVVMDSLLDDVDRDRAYDAGYRDGERDDRRDDSSGNDSSNNDNSGSDGWNTSNVPSGDAGDSWDNSSPDNSSWGDSSSSSDSWGSSDSGSGDSWGSSDSSSDSGWGSSDTGSSDWSGGSSDSGGW